MSDVITQKIQSIQRCIQRAVIDMGLGDLLVFGDLIRVRFGDSS